MLCSLIYNDHGLINYLTTDQTQICKVVKERERERSRTARAREEGGCLIGLPPVCWENIIIERRECTETSCILDGITFFLRKLYR